MAEESEFSVIGGEDGGEVMVDLVEGGVDLEVAGWVSSGMELFSFLFLSFKKIIIIKDLSQKKKN